MLRLIPDSIDFTFKKFANSITSERIKYLEKKFYSTMQPIIINTYIVNLEGKKPIFGINSEIEIIWNETHSKLIKQCLQINLISENLQNQPKTILFYPYIGVLQIQFSINNNAKCQFLRETIKLDIIFTTFNWEITGAGSIKSVSSANKDNKIDKLTLSIELDLIPTPNRFMRILFDTYHNLYYPWDKYIPKDNITGDQYPYNFDWTLETLDTNYFQVILSNL